MEIYRKQPNQRIFPLFRRESAGHNVPSDLSDGRNTQTQELRFKNASRKAAGRVAQTCGWGTLRNGQHRYSLSERSLAASPEHNGGLSEAGESRRPEPLCVLEGERHQIDLACAASDLPLDVLPKLKWILFSAVISRIG